MRPNNVYDRYRWKKMDQPMERGATAAVDAVSGQKIPVLTTTGGGNGGGGGTSSPTRMSESPSSQSTPTGGGSSTTSPVSRRANKRKNSSVNLTTGNAAARKRRKIQQAQQKTGDAAGADQGPQTKNTVAVLNELKRNLVYNMESQTGPVHAPLFTMSVVVDGQKFMGHGRSKKLARIEAAAAALRSFIQFKDGATLTPIKPLQNVDFTSDDPMIDNSIFPMADPPALPESIVTTPAAAPVTPNNKSKGASEREYKDRHNGPNHNNNNNNTNNNNNVHSTNNSNSPYQPSPNSNFSPHNSTITSYYQQTASHNSTTSKTSCNINNINNSNTTSGYPTSYPDSNSINRIPPQSHFHSHHNQHPYTFNNNNNNNHYSSYHYHNHNQVVSHQQSLAQPSNHYYSKTGSSANAFATAIASVTSNSSSTKLTNTTKTTTTTNHSSNANNSNNIFFTTNTTTTTTIPLTDSNSNSNSNCSNYYHFQPRKRLTSVINYKSFNAPPPTPKSPLLPIPPTTHRHLLVQLPPSPQSSRLPPPVLAASAAACPPSGAAAASTNNSSGTSAAGGSGSPASIHATNINLSNSSSSSNNSINSNSSSSSSSVGGLTTPVTAVSAHNGHRQVVEKIQQSLDLFKNSNEKKVAWKKRLEKIKSSSVSASRNVPPGQPPKAQPEKGPVMLLHELFSDAHFECVSTDGLQHSKFTVVVTVDNQRFEGTGPSKKMAKNAAAKAALASMCNISFSPLQQAKYGVMNSATGMGGMGGAGPGGAGINGDAIGGCYDQKNVELPQTFADAIGKLVIEKFNEVMKGNDVYSRRKVLAGIVMTQGYDAKTAKVISLATGTKCVSGEHMSVTGSVINDSHAEIIARRGLLDFFYSQLNLHCQRQTTKGNNATALCNGNSSEDPEPQETSIFAAPADGSGLYKLKDGINFHLYINTAPCGDARVFSPHENDNMDVDKHPNRKARGQLRTKVESGEGTIPVKSSEGIQTWDGVLQGQRLLTMSCSDKISRWNVLGLQGSLLASVIEPIYLHSIVLGSLLHPAHMYRAICGRIESSIQGLPPPYRLNKPRLALMTSAESRNQTKPPNFSINWLVGCPEVEIVNSFTGKLINNNTNTNKMSRLSKQSFYRQFAAVIERLPHARFHEVKPSYGETKLCVPEYLQAKKELFAAFSKEDLGDWLKKPIEQDQFTLMTPKPEELAAPLPVTPANNGSSVGSGAGSNGSGPTSGGK